MNRWFTCTPVDFGGGEDFFARDSGLMCRGFQAIGCESMAVMPGPPRSDDQADLLRTRYDDLESTNWWQSLRLTGVVLYAWGSPRYLNVARAIRNAGVFLVLNQDNGGLVSPLAGPAGWLREQRIMSAGAPQFLRSVAKGIIGLATVDPARAEHLKQGDSVACVSPEAARHYRRLCGKYGGGLVDRIVVIPHPVETDFTYEPTKEKSRSILCVGRWQDKVQKRPVLLSQVLEQYLTTEPDATVNIAGTLGELREWHVGLKRNLRERVSLHGHVSREKLVEMMTAARIFYSPSAFESFGIAAAEALCSGCSVVAGRSPSMSSFGWFVSENSGRLANRDNAAGHARALADEMGCWDYGGRSAAHISSIWSGRLHADKVAEQVCALHSDS